MFGQILGQIAGIIGKSLAFVELLVACLNARSSLVLVLSMCCYFQQPTFAFEESRIL